MALDLVNYAKKLQEMVAINEDAYNSGFMKQVIISQKTIEDIMDTIATGSADQLAALSIEYANKSGIYQRILTLFSTLLTYDVFTVPKKITSKSINMKKYTENYRRAAFFADTVISPKLVFPDVVYKMLLRGAYYAIVLEQGETEVVLKELPHQYCRTRMKNHSNVNILEFDVAFFDSITDAAIKKQAFDEFPKEFKKGYAAYQKDRNAKWMIVPEEMGVAFYFQNQGKPFFISMIPAIANLEEYKKLEKSLDKQELEHILVQKVPINKEGEFILSIDEAAELHTGVVSMLKNNQATDVLTTFAEVELLKIGDKAKNDRDNLEKVERSVYMEAGVSRLLFATDGASSVVHSINTDTALSLSFVEQIANWLTYQTNLRFAEGSKYCFESAILPISHYNKTDMLPFYLKVAQFGYSKLIVGIASGIKQSSLLDLMEMENEILNLDEKLIPLKSSHTGSDDEAGRPTLPTNQKSEKTIENEESQ